MGAQRNSRLSECHGSPHCSCNHIAKCFDFDADLRHCERVSTVLERLRAVRLTESIHSPRGSMIAKSPSYTSPYPKRREA